MSHKNKIHKRIVLSDRGELHVFGKEGREVHAYFQPISGRPFRFKPVEVALDYSSLKRIDQKYMMGILNYYAEIAATRASYAEEIARIKKSRNLN